MAIDPESGKILWRQSYPAPYEPVKSAARHGKGPKSTPLYYDITTGDFIHSAYLAFFRHSTPQPAESNGGRSTPKTSRARGRNSGHRCRRLPTMG
jgi:hypothetical protein